MVSGLFFLKAQEVIRGCILSGMDSPLFSPRKAVLAPEDKLQLNSSRQEAFSLSKSEQQGRPL